MARSGHQVDGVKRSHEHMLIPRVHAHPGTLHNMRHVRARRNKMVTESVRSVSFILHRTPRVCYLW